MAIVCDRFGNTVLDRFSNIVIDRLLADITQGPTVGLVDLKSFYFSGSSNCGFYPASIATDKLSQVGNYFLR